MSNPQEPYQPPRPAAGPLGLPGRPRPARRRRSLRTVLGIASGALLAAVLGATLLVTFVNGATNQARGLADGFTRLVLAGDSSKAYDEYFDPALREHLSKEEFIAGIKTLQMDDTCEPAFDDVEAGTESGTKTADIAGLITCGGGRKIDLSYRFKGTDELKMVTVRLRPQA